MSYGRQSAMSTNEGTAQFLQLNVGSSKPKDIPFAQPQKGNYKFFVRWNEKGFHWYESKILDKRYDAVKGTEYKVVRAYDGDKKWVHQTKVSIIKKGAKVKLNSKKVAVISYWPKDKNLTKAYKAIARSYSSSSQNYDILYDDGDESNVSQDLVYKLRLCAKTGERCPTQPECPQPQKCKDNQAATKNKKEEAMKVAKKRKQQKAKKEAAAKKKQKKAQEEAKKRKQQKAKKLKEAKLAAEKEKQEARQEQRKAQVKVCELDTKNYIQSRRSQQRVLEDRKHQEIDIFNRQKRKFRKLRDADIEKFGYEAHKGWEMFQNYRKELYDEMQQRIKSQIDVLRKKWLNIYSRSLSVQRMEAEGSKYAEYERKRLCAVVAKDAKKRLATEKDKKEKDRLDRLYYTDQKKWLKNQTRLAAVAEKKRLKLKAKGTETKGQGQ